MGRGEAIPGERNKKMNTNLRSNSIYRESIIHLRAEWAQELWAIIPQLCLPSRLVSHGSTNGHSWQTCIMVSQAQNLGPHIRWWGSNCHQPVLQSCLSLPEAEPSEPVWYLHDGGCTKHEYLPHTKVWLPYFPSSLGIRAATVAPDQHCLCWGCPSQAGSIQQG